MNLDELNKVALAMVAPGKGILAADESSGTIKKRFDAIGVENRPRTIAATIARCCSAQAEGMKHISGVILYDETIWQKAKDGTPLVDIIKKAGAHPRHQGRRRHQAAAELPGRSRHHRPRQARRPAAEILRAGRALRQMARGDRHRRRHSDPHLHLRQCACAGALCRALPGGADRADRRAGSADGRRPRHRPLRQGHRMGAEGDRSSSCTTNRVALEGMVLKPNMAVSGKKSANKRVASRKSPRRP